ncbi:D-3-phosphoglycerate dehydrogenase [Lachnospiraceae bacterium KM106-2]|nr:D-3-phosphoglycerate dehydrogenase [Lachnospiraceae bacterium KM106-2]
MKIVFLEESTLGQVDLSCFDQLGEVVRYDNTTIEEASDRVEDADILIVNKLPMDERTLSNAKKLKYIAVTATGTNIIDLDYMKKRNIVVSNVAGYSTQSVAQHTFAMLFYVLEQLSYYDDYVKTGGYVKSPIFTHVKQPFFQISGKTWGIIGLGEIGREVASVAKAFGCRVIYYSASGRNHNPNYEQVDFETLLKESDVISIHAPLTEKTHHLMDLSAFRQMKSHAILVNVGRGPIIVEEDLAVAIEEGIIGGAALDVLDVEPMKENHPLLNLKNENRLLITPHIAWASDIARETLMKEVFENVSAYLNGEDRNLVTR